MDTQQEWYYWESKIGQIMRSPYRGKLDDWIRGECSGLPACCIKFFMEEGAGIEHWNEMDKAREEGFEFRYVPCPDCLIARRFVQIRSCDGSHCFCGQWEHRQFVDDQLQAIEPEVRRARKRWKRQVRMFRKKRRGWA